MIFHSSVKGYQRVSHSISRPHVVTISGMHKNPAAFHRSHARDVHERDLDRIQGPTGPLKRKAGLVGDFGGRGSAHPGW